MFSVEVEITLLPSACVFNILADLMFHSKESYLSFKVSFNLLEKKKDEDLKPNVIKRSFRSYLSTIIQLAKFKIGLS